MSKINTENPRVEPAKRNTQEEILRYTKVVAFLLAEIKGVDLDQILNDMEHK